MTDRPRLHGDPVLAAHDIVNRFGRQVVHDRISLDVFSGEIVGIAGASGSGKSVLLKTLVGLQRPNAGEVRLNDRRIKTISPAEKARLIGVLFQQGALFSSLSVADNVMLPLREHTTLPAEQRQTIAAMKLALAGLPADSAPKLPSQLSGGMVKRAALARALALDPRLLFLDEPTSGLDPVIASGIDTLILELNRSLGVTVVIVTHDLTTLLGCCSRIAVLADKKISIDTPDKLMRSTQPWIHRFLHDPRAVGAKRAAASAREQRHGN